MKYIHLFLSCFILLVACQTELPDDPYPTLSASFRLNGELCLAESWSVADQNFPGAYLIIIEKDGLSGSLDYHLSFAGVPTERGNYTITSDSFPTAHLSITLGGDVVVGQYMMVPNGDNFIKLDEVSADLRFLKGQFEFTYTLSDRFDPSVVVPDTIEISDGLFESVKRD